MNENLKRFFSTLRSVIRIFVLTVLFFIDGLQKVIFDGMEIIRFEYLVKPLGVDEDKLAYIDKLNNLIEGGIDSNVEYISDEEDEEE